jgi:hypothetical protein
MIEALDASGHLFDMVRAQRTVREHDASGILLPPASSTA